VLLPTLLWPTGPRRVWQQGYISKIERSVSESESVDFGHRTIEDAFAGPVVTGVRKTSVIRWIITIRTESSLLIAAYERNKVVAWLLDDNPIEVAAVGDRVYLRTSGKKEHRLDLVSVQPVPT